MPQDDFNDSYIIGKTRSGGIKRKGSFLSRYQDQEKKKEEPQLSIKDKLLELERTSYIQNPSYNMLRLIEILNERKYGYPNPGDIFTFVYRARTPRILYDENPISTIITFDYDKFVGYNHHLGMTRNYSGKDGQVLSKFYKIMPDELDIVLKINTKLLKRT